MFVPPAYAPDLLRVLSILRSVNEFEIALVVHVVKVADGELAHDRVGIVLGDGDQFIEGFAAPVLGQRADDVLLHLLVLQAVVNLDQGVRAFIASDG